ncbi:MAG: prepilin-type N-terminal cleavage/methylation domain-containing protein [Terriglobia bacterium]|jgi:prepilin-type N-terminal cleavage/methylation domain-containing protein
MDNGNKGFSLIELLIVVAIILIIAAIAVPNFLRSRIAANQASAVASLRTFDSAEIIYSATYGAGYTLNIGVLAPLATTATNPTSTAAGLIDSVLASGSKSGYSFTYSPGISDSTGRINTYAITAVPINSNTGTNYYYTDQSGVIRMNSTTTAASTDSPLAG